MAAIHEHIAEAANRFNGTIAREGWLHHLETHLQVELRSRAWQDDIFSYHCPIAVRVGTDPRQPGSFFWYFEVTDPQDILWVSIHKTHVDTHFPARLFPHGRPELPDYEGNHDAERLAR